jgi:hypothetical protein
MAGGGMSNNMPDAGGNEDEPTDSIIIHTRRADSYVILTDDYLHWTETVEANAEVFDRYVDGGSFKLKATSNNMWVRINNADEDALVADLATDTNAATFESVACGPDDWSSLEATNDNDATTFVKSDGATQDGTVDRMEVQNGSCGITGSSWEQFEICDSTDGCDL